MGVTLEGGLHLTAPSYPKGIILGDKSQPLQSIYEQSSTQNYHLGTKLMYDDGRVFRYALNGAVDLSKALMASSAATESKWFEIAQATSGTSVEIGDQEIIVDITTGSSKAENAWADGSLVVNKSTGLGDIYKVLASKLVTGDDTKVRVLLETPIRTAWAAGSEITVMLNRWYKTVVFATTRVAVAAGVPLIDVTAAYYYWAQTGGDCPMLVDAGDTLVLGGPVGEPGTHGTAGGVGVVANDGTDEVWGFARYIADAGEAAIIDLCLDR